MKQYKELYNRYGKTSDESIRLFLDNIKIVILTNKGVGTLHGYYPLKDEIIKKIKSKPRRLSITWFSADSTEDECMTNLKVVRTVSFLVKSTSRFIVKPDIGEIIDQIDSMDFTAIEILHSVYSTVSDTEGEHFIMQANLLK